MRICSSLLFSPLLISWIPQLTFDLVTRDRPSSGASPTFIGVVIPLHSHPNWWLLAGRLLMPVVAHLDPERETLTVYSMSALKLIYNSIVDSTHYIGGVQQKIR